MALALRVEGLRFVIRHLVLSLNLLWEQACWCFLGYDEAGGCLGLTCSRSSMPRGERGAARLVLGIRPWARCTLQLNPPQMLWNITSHASRAERQKHLAWFCLNEQISIVRVIALCSVMHLLLHLLFAITQPNVSRAKKITWYGVGEGGAVLFHNIFWARELTLP